MKRAIWTTLMLLLAGFLFVPSTPKDASAFQSCYDQACKRNNHCLVQCGPCNSPSPILPGSCTI